MARNLTLVFLGLCLVATAFLASGRYAVAPSRDGIIYVVDRLTGGVRACRGSECQAAKEPPDFSANADPVK